MPYLGIHQDVPGANIKSYRYKQGTDTDSGATSFPAVNKGADEVRVYHNGLLLKLTADYSFTTSAVTISPAPADDDEIQVDVYTSMNIADTVSASDGGTFTNAVTFQGGVKSGTVTAQDGTSAVTIADSTGNVAVSSALDVSAGTLTTSTTQKEAIVDGGKGNLAKADVGLGSVDDTADSAKPVSTAQQTEIDQHAHQSAPHIIPGVLYPSYVASGTSNKLLDGSTSHSGDFGTAQSDGRKYYYTNIAGSKPIKDPRIGAHFGSQRHKFKSMQLLEQETPTHGNDVYSVDGREWIRAVGPSWVEGNETWGHSFYSPYSASDSTYFIEIVGYFSDANFLGYSGTTYDIKVSTDGGSQTTNTGMTATVNTPLSGRYVDAGSVLNLGLSQTLGIHTLKLANVNGDYLGPAYGIELIAQDTQDFTATNATNILTTTGHTLTNGDQIKLTGSDLPDGLSATTTYYVVGVSGNNFQVSTSLGGSAVTFSDDGTGTRTWTALNNIQIPSQNVVSYGKKFSVSGAPHYNPFAQSQTGADVTINSSTTNTAKLTGGWSGTGATYYSSELDTDTSLGLSAWESTDYYRPVNGGRIVWWVNSSGDLKCSVNMMPPAGTGIGTSNTSGNVPTGQQNWATQYQPVIHSTTIDNSQAEVAKTFHWREFGNGAANSAGGDGKGGNADETYADASMLNANDDIAYVMDDGLTSLSGKARVNSDPTNGGTLRHQNVTTGEGFYFTFIGTGVSYSGHPYYRENTFHRNDLVQNLPYGTHIVAMLIASGTNATDIKVDGVTVRTTVDEVDEWRGGVHDITFHQPKRPPIPEDAVVIADYMLMADFVKQTDAEDGQISKGVRGLSGTRDVFYDASSALNRNTEIDVSIAPWGFVAMAAPGSTNPGIATLPFFGTNAVVQVQERTTTHTIDFAGSTDVDKTGLDNSTTSYGDKFSIDDDATLGLNTITTNIQTGGYRFSGYYLATPIHTSSHYQSFETPFLHELVGGDRNMEQNNLIVTPDGKSWDEVTRYVSYLGNVCLSASTDNETTWSTTIILDEWRGRHLSIRDYFNKNFAIAYDRLICLEDGQYKLITNGRSPGNSEAFAIYKNGANILSCQAVTDDASFTSVVPLQLQRGDYIQLIGAWQTSETDGWFSIERIV